MQNDVFKRSIVALIVGLAFLGGMATLWAEDDEKSGAEASAQSPDGDEDPGDESEESDASGYIEEVAPQELIDAYDAPDDPLEAPDAHTDSDLEDADCEQRDECREDGACQAASYIHYIRQTTDTELVGPGCFPDPEGCANSVVCAEYGWCGYKRWYGGVRCTPKSDLHCRQSEICRRFGHCAAQGVSSLYCAPTDDAHCEQSEACRLEGKCSYGNRSYHRRRPDRTLCRAEEDAECEQSEVCQREGRCTAESGRCVRESEDE